MNHKRIMLVEDDQVNIMMTKSFLEKSGYEVTAFSTGASAVNAYHHDPFHFILMDLCLPDMSGFAVTESVRMIEQQGLIDPAYIIAISAHTHVDYREKCKRSGMNGFLPKPYKPFELIEALEQSDIKKSALLR